MKSRIQVAFKHLYTLEGGVAPAADAHLAAAFCVLVCVTFHYLRLMVFPIQPKQNNDRLS
jgi:hypothetical protein